jgi:hypothetical protein
MALLSSQGVHLDLLVSKIVPLAGLAGRRRPEDGHL